MVYGIWYMVETKTKSRKLNNIYSVLPNSIFQRQFSTLWHFEISECAVWYYDIYQPFKPDLV